MKKAVLIFSGGLDSTTLLYQLLKEQNWNITLLSFLYGQKHAREIESARFFAEKFHLEHKVCSLDFFPEITHSSLLTNGEEIPKGHYEAENMKSTIVPNRNMILLSIAAAHAISVGAKDLFYGAHAGDHAIYPDCRPIFIKKMRAVLAICDYEKINLHAPFQDLKKDKIVSIGQELGVDFAHTWTCYNGKEKPCGECGSCVERAESFAYNGLCDPLLEQ